jgi:rhodanese-related sulfurtransferase
MPRPPARHRPLVKTLLLLLILRGTSLAQEPVCGIHAVYTASLLLGGESRMSDLLDPRYVGSEKGSSIAELERAAAMLGLESLALGRLTPADLRRAEWPVVLHTRSNLSSAEYDHFVLFAGFDGERAVVFDGAKGPKSWTLADLSSRWDGNGLVLATGPIDSSRLVSASRWRLLLWIAPIIAGLATLRMLQTRCGGFGGTRWSAVRNQAAVLLACAAFAAIVFHLMADTGFVAGASTARAVRAANASTFLPKLGYEAVARLIDGGAATVIDARRPEDFETGALPGAINIPAILPESEARERARALPPDRRIIVYCSNAPCPYSYIAAQRLLDAGFTDVVVYAEGWDEWKVKSPMPEAQ